MTHVPCQVTADLNRHLSLLAKEEASEHAAEACLADIGKPAVRTDRDDEDYLRSELLEIVAWGEYAEQEIASHLHSDYGEDETAEEIVRTELHELLTLARDAAEWLDDGPCVCEAAAPGFTAPTGKDRVR